MIKAIVFDGWGTLFESKEASSAFYEINTALGKSFKDFEYLKVFEKATCLDSTGNPQTVAKRLADSLGECPSDETLARISSYFATAFTSDVNLFPDAADILPQLHQNYKLGLLSNSGLQSADNLRRCFPLATMFDEILFSYEVGLLKPDSRFFATILQRLEVLPNETVFVGDHPHVDVEGAALVGIHAVLIDRKQRNVGAAPQRCEDLHEILGFLAGW